MLGLLGALRERIQQHGGGGLEVTIEAPAPLPPLSAAVEVAAYYIAQEALANVGRHAGAHHCRLRLILLTDLASASGTSNVPVLEVAIWDDGRGLPLPGEKGHGGLGLTSMQQRAAELGGTCLVERMAGGGTCVCARLPCFVTS